MLFALLPVADVPVIRVEDRGGYGATLDTDVRNVELSADGRWARAAGAHGTTLFDARSGRPTHRRGLRFVPNLNVCGTFDEHRVGAFRTDDTGTGRLLSYPDFTRLPPEDDTHRYGSFTYSDGEDESLFVRVPFGAAHDPFEVYDGAGQRVARIDGYKAVTVALARNGRQRVAYLVDAQGHGRFVDLRTMVRIRDFDLPNDDRYASLRVSDDGRRAAIVTGDYTGWLVDLDSARSGRPYRGIAWHAFTPDLRRAIVRGESFYDVAFPPSPRAWIKDLEPSAGSLDGLGVGRLLRDPEATARMAPVFRERERQQRLRTSTADTEEAVVNAAYRRQGFEFVDKRSGYPPYALGDPRPLLEVAPEFALAPGEYRLDLRLVPRDTLLRVRLFRMEGTLPSAVPVPAETHRTDDGKGTVLLFTVESRASYRVLVESSRSDGRAVRVFRRRVDMVTPLSPGTCVGRARFGWTATYARLCGGVA